MVDLITAVLRVPVFSVKQPAAFQVMAALPVPQPSTLVGALAYGIGVVEGRGTAAYDWLLDLARRGRLMAARGAPLPRGGTPLVFSPVVLRRFRLVDKAHESKEKGKPKPVDLLRGALERRDYAEYKRLMEVELTDALFREYVFGLEMLAVWVVEEGLVDQRAVWSIARLGDTESLCSVVDVSVERRPIVRRRIVRTVFAAPWEEGTRVSGGSFLYLKCCDEARELRTYIVPGSRAHVRAGRSKCPIFRPSEVVLEYEKEVPVCETPFGDVVLRGGVA